MVRGMGQDRITARATPLGPCASHSPRESTVGSPQHLDATSEGEPCHQETGVLPEPLSTGEGRGNGMSPTEHEW